MGRRCGGAGSRTLERRLGILEASRGFATETAELGEGSTLPVHSISFRLTASKSMPSDNRLTTGAGLIAPSAPVSRPGAPHPLACELSPLNPVRVQAHPRQSQLVARARLR